MTMQSTSPPSTDSNPAAFALILLGAVCLAIALPALLAALLIWLFVRASRARMAGALIPGLFGLGFVLWQWVGLQSAAGAFAGAVAELPYQSSAWGALWSDIGVLWRLTFPLAPLMGALLAVARPLVEVTQLVPRRKNVPEQVKGVPVLGMAVSGDLALAQSRSYAVYPLDLLKRHAIFVGSSGSGKTEALLRIAYLVRKLYGWQVVYLDAKGDRETAARFTVVMEAAGAQRQALFPLEAYNGWKGDGTALFNRLMQIQDYSESSFYKSGAKDYLELVCNAPGGPPRSSVQLLDRLWMDRLVRLYEGDPRQEEAMDFEKDEMRGFRKRYRGFFNSLNRKLDGTWDFGGVDAAYILLEGTSQKEDSFSLGRYFFEDFSHYAVSRKPRKKRVLFIADELSALTQARQRMEASNLFERLRSYGVAVLVSVQSRAGLGSPEEAERILGAAAGGVFLFQNDEPEVFTRRAGTQRAMVSSYQVRQKGVFGAPAMGTPTGAATLHEREEPRVDPNKVRQLGVGECFLIARGAALHMQIKKVEVDNQSVDELVQLYDQALGVPQKAKGPAITIPLYDDEVAGEVTQELVDGQPDRVEEPPPLLAPSVAVAMEDEQQNLEEHGTREPVPESSSPMVDHSVVF